jgi:hypothetical protein
MINLVDDGRRSLSGGSNEDLEISPVTTRIDSLVAQVEGLVARHDVLMCIMGRVQISLERC